MIKRIDADRHGVRFEEEEISAEGKRTVTTVTAKFDGAFHPVEGSPVIDSVRYERLSSRVIRGTGRNHGKPIGTWTIRVSKDGTSMREEYTSTTLEGKKVRGWIVMERQ